MYKRLTNYPESKEDKKVYSKKEARNHEGGGTICKRDSSGRKVSDPSSNSVPLEKVNRTRVGDHSQGKKFKVGPQIRGLEKEKEFEIL